MQDISRAPGDVLGHPNRAQVRRAAVDGGVALRSKQRLGVAVQ